jgi:oligopeptide/dipeptide ABC transporter ATP-binding protein
MAVMYLGKIVEIANKEDLFSNQLHPYAKALFSAIPIPDPEVAKRRDKINNIEEREGPRSINPPSGCRFHPRCEYAMEVCKKKSLKLIDAKRNHFAVCYLLE